MQRATRSAFAGLRRPARVARFAAAALGLAATTLPAWTGGGDSPVELGVVRWQRDLDAALAESKAEGRPLAVLFQEVPG